MNRFECKYIKFFQVFSIKFSKFIDAILLKLTRFFKRISHFKDFSFYFWCCRTKMTSIWHACRKICQFQDLNIYASIDIFFFLRYLHMGFLLKMISLSSAGEFRFLGPFRKGLMQLFLKALLRYFTFKFQKIW